jgi:ABC-type nitrate/sulfonate/bicarbonate transport system permease component
LAEWLDGFNGVGTLMITASADQEIQLLMAACLTAVLISLLGFTLVEVAAIIAARRGYRVDQITLGSGT